MTLNKFRTKELIWDKAGKRIYDTLEANSGDSNGRKLVVQVLDGGVIANLTGAQLYLSWKPITSKHKGLDAFKAVDLSKGIFEIAYTTEMLSNVGKLRASLVLIDKVGRVESNLFTITVSRSNVDDDSVQSEDSFTALTEALVKVTDLEENYAPRLNEVTAQLAQKVGGLEPKGLAGVSFDTQSPRIIDVIDDYVYGYSGTSLYRRSVDGGSWVAFLNYVPGRVRILKTDDGEMLVMSSFNIYKSSGWGSQNVTWEEKVVANGTTVFLRWGIDGDGEKFIATTYEAGGDFSDSRYVWVSLDRGDTWKVVYDSVDVHGSDVANESHMHAVAYDKWADRFYMSEGHGVIAGIYVSEDDGQTWKRPEGMILNPAPTTITPTPTGLVCGTDSTPNGLYGVVRNKDAMKEELVQTWTWHTGREGLIGFAQRGYYDKFSGMVYVSFRSNYQNVKPVIVAGTPTSGGLVYTWDSGGVGQDDRIDNVVIPNENELLASAVAGSNSVTISGKIVPPGVNTSKESVISGRSDHESSVAIGWGSNTNGAQSLAVGVGSSAVGVQNSTAIGYNSKANNNAVSIGTNSYSDGTGVSVGENANSTGGLSVAVGYLATSISDGVAVGKSARASVSGVAIGVNAEAIDEQANAVAIGRNSKSHEYGVALGNETQTTRSWQVAVGQRHLEFEPLSGTNTGGYTHETVRLFTRKNSEGKFELCAQFPGADTYANTTVIATQGVR